MTHRPDEPPGEVAPAPPPAATQVFGAALPTAQAYADILASEGVQRGLIGPREVERLWDRHLLNSAAVSVAIGEGSTVVDIGSGAGLPGIPLAMARPDLRVTLVEPLLRRSLFLQQVTQALAMPRVTVVRARAEDMPPGSFDVVVARAVAPLRRLTASTLPLLRPGGRLVALKGRTAERELAHAEADLRRRGARSWEVRDLPTLPGVPATRAIIVVAGQSRRQR